MRKLHWIGLTVFAMTTLASAEALAGSSGTADVACGSTSAMWNAPNGALVLNKGHGPVRSTLAAVGENMTHSMISHGSSTGGWVSHSTMYTPGTNGWPTYCSTPIKAGELRDGFPGSSQTKQGGIYTFLYGNGTLDSIFYQRSMTAGALTNHGADIANYMWNSLPYVWTTSKNDGAQGFYRIGFAGGSGTTNYSLYQYRDDNGIEHGEGGTWNNGSVCSTLIAYAHNKAAKGTVTDGYYDHAKVQSAINGLRTGVEDDCNKGMGFWSGLGASVTCFEGICDDASRQVTNCMSTGQCGTDDSNVYSGVYNDTKAVATSISPDRLGGWSGHPWSNYGTAGGASAWAYDNQQTVQWNSAGNQYSCWF
jgi:hypothetical protein